VSYLGMIFGIIYGHPRSHVVTVIGWDKKTNQIERTRQGSLSNSKGYGFTGSKLFGEHSDSESEQLVSE